MLPNQTKVKAPVTSGGHQTNTRQAVQSDPSIPNFHPTEFTITILARELCTPNCMCARSDAKRCRCTCQGTLHGALLWSIVTPNLEVAK